MNQRRAGTHPKVLSAMLGHSKVQLAMDVYDHVNVEEMRRPLEQMLQSCYQAGIEGTFALDPRELVGPPGFEPGTNGL